MRACEHALSLIVKFSFINNNKIIIMLPLSVYVCLIPWLVTSDQSDCSIGGV